MSIFTYRECVKTKTNLLEPKDNEFNIAKLNSLHKPTSFLLEPTSLHITNKFYVGTNKFLVV